MPIRALLLCLLLAACAGHSEPPGGSKRADGAVAVSSTDTIYDPVGPDWPAAEAGAAGRCRARGEGAVASFVGWREACRYYDRHGRCLVTKVTRYYACSH